MLDLSRAVPRRVSILEQDEQHVKGIFSGKGSGIELTGMTESKGRYLVGDITVMADHSTAMMFRCYTEEGSDERLFMRFGLIPEFKTRVCIDLELLDMRSIYTNRTPGMLKLVVHGQRTQRESVVKFEMGIEKTYKDVTILFENFYLSDEIPDAFPVPDEKLVDEFGQWKKKDWPGKVENLEQLRENLSQYDAEPTYLMADWNRWGGDSRRKITEGTGFFSTYKTEDGRWHLVDPEGCDYFSFGPCGVFPGDVCRIDSFDENFDWLPDFSSKEYGEFLLSGSMKRAPYMPLDHYNMFRFTSVTLKRLYGEDWFDQWSRLTYNILMGNGFNSQGNFTGLGVNDGTGLLPYVRQLPEFPLTETLIFRDFPDVLSKEYKEKSEVFASQLETWKDDPLLIGYFLRNEPEFNFIEGLAIADEVLAFSEVTDCKLGFIQWLKDTYTLIEDMNAAWGTEFLSFEALLNPIKGCSETYPDSSKDIHAYSRFLIEEYVRIPSEACKQVDKNHLNLGLRWSKADNMDMMSGWQHFDVFSINCYDFDPTVDMDFVKNAGVDLPIIMGEFHSGALDLGLTATGLKGVANQEERAKMFRRYVESVAAHPYGVGAHWFQFNDQFCLGRYDGENYQIGLVDICMQPHPEMMTASRKIGQRLYGLRNGEVEPFNEVAEKIPMIGY